MTNNKYPTPTKPGFYWAKWKQCVPGTADEEHFLPSSQWETVEVWENGIDENDPEYLLVFVGGVQKAQTLDCFFWGRGPLEPPKN